MSTIISPVKTSNPKDSLSSYKTRFTVSVARDFVESSEHFGLSPQPPPIASARSRGIFATIS